MARGRFMRRTGPWRGIRRFLTRWPMTFPKALDKALKAESVIWAGQMKMFVNRVGPNQWVPNRPITIFLKGGSQPLHRWNDLSNSIQPKRIRFAFHFAGVHRTAVNRRGILLANVAEINEMGHSKLVQIVTKKQQGFFKYLVKAKKMLYIPRVGSRIRPGQREKRAFAGPTYERLAPKTPKRFANRIVKEVLKEAGFLARRLP